jgi:hypothetical protein
MLGFARFLCLLMLAMPALADWKAPREALDQRLIVGPYAIYYTLDGPDAIVPELPLEQRKQQAAKIVAELGRQLVEADRYYSKTLGLTPPLQNKRYRNVPAIDVHVIDLGEKTGSTGDGVITYAYHHFKSPSPAITIAVSNRWHPPNLTPNHEMFHAYQYGYTFFKTPWFLEGLARSMEHGFSDKPVRTEPLPITSQALQAIMQRSYRADVFWNRLMQLCGTQLVRPLLERLQSLDQIAAKSRGLDASDWPEDEQRSARNNPYLLQGVKQSIQAQCRMDDSKELKQFYQLLQQEALPEIN